MHTDAVHGINSNLASPQTLIFLRVLRISLATQYKQENGNGAIPKILNPIFFTLNRLSVFKYVKARNYFAYSLTHWRYFGWWYVLAITTRRKHTTCKKSIESWTLASIVGVCWWSDE